MTSTVLMPKKGFLILGLGLIVISAFMLYFNFVFLEFLYLMPGIFLILLYLIPTVELRSDSIRIRAFWGNWQKINWHEVKSVQGTYRNSLIIESNKSKIRILDIYKDRKQITDYIIKHVDKNTVSRDLISEWSQYFFLYQDDDPVN